MKDKLIAVVFAVAIGALSYYLCNKYFSDPSENRRKYVEELLELGITTDLYFKDSEYETSTISYKFIPVSESYKYRVAYQTKSGEQVIDYEGDIHPKDFAKHFPKITYLPASPDISSYNPEKEINILPTRGSVLYIIGGVIVGIFALLMLIGAFVNDEDIEDEEVKNEEVA